MTQPKPVSLTVAATATGSEGLGDPQPIVAIGGLPAATATVRGGVQQGVHVANATVATDATSAATQLNALLATLRAKGIIASS